MRRLIWAAALALGGCNGQPPAPAPSGEPAGNDHSVNFSAEVLALTDAQRNGVMLRAIRDAGIDCQGVTANKQMPGEGGPPVWQAKCNDGRSHYVQVTPDGTANVIGEPAK